MKVFLGWSGTRSKKTAEIFGDWLGQVIQAIDPWISSDILKGARWSEEIADKLEEAKVGIICLTKENLNENWILFEAGALSKTKDAHVCTFLLDLKPTDIKQPLALFQHTEFEKEDVRKLTHTINQAVEDAGERSLDVKRLDTIFNRFWPDLEEKFKEIETIQSEVRKPIRSEREILEEILETVRKQERRPRQEEYRGVYPDYLLKSMGEAEYPQSKRIAKPSTKPSAIPLIKRVREEFAKPEMQISPKISKRTKVKIRPESEDSDG